MPDPESTSPEYREVLRLLVLLNSSVKFIVAHLRVLASDKIFDSDYLNRLTAATKQVDQYLKDTDIGM